MFKKKMIIALFIVLALSILATPVSAKRERDWDQVIPSPPYNWEIYIVQGGPCIVDEPNDPGWQLWWYSFKVAMPPRYISVPLVVIKDGVIVPGHEWIVTFADSKGWHTGPIWELNPPDSITYTFMLTVGGRTITEDLVVDFSDSEICPPEMFD